MENYLARASASRTAPRIFNTHSSNIFFFSIAILSFFRCISLVFIFVGITSTVPSKRLGTTIPRLSLRLPLNVGLEYSTSMPPLPLAMMQSSIAALRSIGRRLPVFCCWTRQALRTSMTLLPFTSCDAATSHMRLRRGRCASSASAMPASARWRDTVGAPPSGHSCL
jgi:hypothetical protein